MASVISSAVGASPEPRALEQAQAALDGVADGHGHVVTTASATGRNTNSRSTRTPWHAGAPAPEASPGLVAVHRIGPVADRQPRGRQVRRGAVDGDVERHRDVAGEVAAELQAAGRHHLPSVCGVAAAAQIGRRRHPVRRPGRCGRTGPSAPGRRRASDAPCRGPSTGRRKSGSETRRNGRGHAASFERRRRLIARRPGLGECAPFLGRGRPCAAVWSWRPSPPWRSRRAPPRSPARTPRATSSDAPRPWSISGLARADQKARSGHPHGIADGPLHHRQALRRRLHPDGQGLSQGRRGAPETSRWSPIFSILCVICSVLCVICGSVRRPERIELQVAERYVDGLRAPHLDQAAQASSARGAASRPGVFVLTHRAKRRGAPAAPAPAHVVAVAHLHQRVLTRRARRCPPRSRNAAPARPCAAGPPRS